MIQKKMYANIFLTIRKIHDKFHKRFVMWPKLRSTYKYFLDAKQLSGEHCSSARHIFFPLRTLYVVFASKPNQTKPNQEAVESHRACGQFLFYPE